MITGPEKDLAKRDNDSMPNLLNDTKKLTFVKRNGIQLFFLSLTWNNPHFVSI